MPGSEQPTNNNEELARSQYEAACRVHPEGTLWFPPDEMTKYLAHARDNNSWGALVKFMRTRVDEAREAKYGG